MNQKNQKEMTMTKLNTKNIVDALSKFQQEANVAVKDSKNPFFKSTYAALEDVIAAANQGAKFGLAFTQTIDYEKQNIEGVIDTTMYVTTSLMHSDSDAVIKSRYLIIPKNLIMMIARPWDLLLLMPRDILYKLSMDYLVKMMMVMLIKVITPK